MIKEDRYGNAYENVGNIRITYKKKGSRELDKDAADDDVISFRAYKNEDSDALHMGAELTLKNKDSA